MLMIMIMDTGLHLACMDRSHILGLVWHIGGLGDEMKRELSA
jgi:hypothetical protein